MRWPTAKQNPFVVIALVGFGIAMCAWQVEEHFRMRHAAREALVNRGRDITSTLGVVVRSQRHWVFVPKDRLESALHDLVGGEDLESLAILRADGEPIASAGAPVELTPEMRERGVYWREHSLVLINLMDLGSNGTADNAEAQPAIVVADTRAALRPPSAVRRPAGQTAPSRQVSPNPPAAPAAGSPPAAPGRPCAQRRLMSEAAYQDIIRKQGVHGLIIVLSTDSMQRAVQSDLILRLLVSLLAVGAAGVSILAWRNIGETAQLQIRLIKAGEMNAHLKEMNLAAAGLAHETRNPLNLIRGLGQVIAMQPLGSEKLKEHASTIVEEADRVTVQLNEFINYSKPREAHLGPVAVSRLVTDVARPLLPDIEEKQISLTKPSSGLVVSADEQLFRQALFNLLLNAVQAVGPQGHIDVRLSEDGGREAALEIRDNGPGVPPADRASIFKPYVTMRPKGVGLGLAIVQQIVAAHGWEISCGANEPAGAVFRISHLKVAAPLL